MSHPRRLTVNELVEGRYVGIVQGLIMSFQNRRIKVFAHVAYGFSSKNWNQSYLSGRLVGLNEPFAYGYHRAESMGCDVTYSTDYPLSPVERLMRLGLRFIFGFDLVHAIKNRRDIFQAEIVWTHTESQHLSILFLAMLTGRKPPRMICQSVWLMDTWKKLTPIHRALFRSLMRKTDVLTFLSEENVAMCRRLLPKADVRLMLFGISGDRLDGAPAPVLSASSELEIIAVGNDRHRDWHALVDQFANTPYRVRIVSTKAKLKRLPPNIRVEPARTHAELVDAYRGCVAAIVPLRPNLHASGITAVLEAALFARPVVATRIGGLDRGYFSDAELYFADPDRPDSLLAAVDEIVRDPQTVKAKTEAALARARTALSAEAYVRAHVELSRELLQRRPAAAKVFARGKSDPVETLSPRRAGSSQFSG